MRALVGGKSDKSDKNGGGLGSLLGLAKGLTGTVIKQSLYLKKHATKFVQQVGKTVEGLPVIGPTAAGLLVTLLSLLSGLGLQLA